MELTIGSFKESASSLDWIDAYNIYMLHQAWGNNLKIKNSQPCKSWKVKNIHVTKPHAAKCVVQSFSSLIIQKFMKTIITYGWITVDAWKWIINYKLTVKYQYASYFCKYMRIVKLSKKIIIIIIVDLIWNVKIW